MTIDDVLHQYPWLWKLLPYHLLEEHCPDCGAGLGQLHRPECDVPRCTACGEPRLWCACGWRESKPERWIGTMYAQDTRVALEQGFFCRCLIQDPDEQWRSGSWYETLEARNEGRPHRFWVPCGPHDAEAAPDINAAAQFQKRAKLK